MINNFSARRALRYAAVAALAIGVASCSEDLPAEPEFLPERIKADMAYLASDELRGREAGTEGYEKAADYVANAMKDLGVKPAGTDGYFQEITFKTATLDPEQVSGTITVAGNTQALKQGEQFFALPNVHQPEGTAEGGMVFVGYGVSAPMDGHDDLADVDLKGKIVVYLNGAPEGLHSEIRSHYRSSAPKNAEFARRGAVGSLMVLPAAAVQQYGPRFAGPQTRWTPPEGKSVGEQLAFTGLVATEALEPLFAGAEMSAAAIRAALEAGEPLKSFDLPGTGSFTQKANVEVAFKSANVLGMIKGSDMPDEYVVMSAHLDHVGVYENRKSETDQIHNGAMDNASGIATMLEVARAYKLTQKQPRRSILLAAVTAEEKGLQGAAYFNHFPTVDEDAMVANVNLDMPILLYDFQDVVAFGAERSDIGDITKGALAEVGIELTPDPLPEQTLFVRSDHYEFVKQGVPSVFLMTGFKDTPDGESGEEIFKNFLATNYHSPMDDMTQPIRFDVAAKFAKVNFLIIDGIANRDQRPMWKAGDYFGLTYGPANTAKAQSR